MPSLFPSLPFPSFSPQFLSVLVFFLSVALCDGRLILPQLGVREWQSHDAAFKARLAPLHSALSSDSISPSEAARGFSTLLSDFLEGNDVFSQGEGRGGGGRRGNIDASDEAFIQAKAEKKRLRRLVFRRGARVEQGLRAQFYQAVRLVSHIRGEREKR